MKTLLQGGGAAVPRPVQLVPAHTAAYSAPAPPAGYSQPAAPPAGYSQPAAPPAGYSQPVTPVPVPEFPVPTYLPINRDSEFPAGFQVLVQYIAAIVGMALILAI